MIGSKSALICSLALTVFTGPALADTVNFDFIAKTKQSSVPYMTGTGEGVIHLASEWLPIEAQGTPLDGATGSCFGTAAMAAGRMTGDGYCSYTDTAGEMVTLRWWLANTEKAAGYWQFIGGTGKWASAVGGGRWLDMPGEKEGMGAAHITGTVEFP
ncbi:hypothetical protein [Roseibium sp.]|uniref:hypothetical protein n=1 Tax=Roseibium sp. TaxID=1936156 RepID=UPI003D0B7577